MKWLAVFVACVPALAQAPAFEVASVKPSDYKGGPLRVTGRVDPDGINLSNVTLAACIRRAYAVAPYQVSGPDWIGTERWMIVAKAAGPTVESKVLEMLQTLLAERFKLKLHREMREMPVLGLVVAKGGPKMKESAGEGATEIGGGDGDEMKFERASMGQLAGVLRQRVGRPVFDETGLKGLYDFTLAVGDGESIFTAVTEQLGLRLEGHKGQVEVLVVDRAERASGN